MSPTTTPTPPLTWALIGASDIAATRVIPAVRRTGGTIRSVVSGSAERAAAYAAEHGLAVGTTDLAAGLEGVDAAYVSSRNDQHAGHTRAALAAGRHVLCEKPVTLDVADAVRLAREAERSGLVMAVNHHLPCSSAVRRVVDLARAGDLGDVLAVRVAHAVHLPERLRGWRLGGGPGDGVILDITCHDASVVNRITGAAPVRLTALAARQGPWEAGSPDAAVVALEYPGDLLAVLHDAFTVPFARTGLEVHGSAGSLYATDVMTQDPRGDLVLVDATGSRPVDVPDRRDLYDVSLSAFASAVAGHGSPVVTALQGAEYLAVAVAAAESSRTGAGVAVTDVAALAARMQP
jgi:1,5-anhydro-D-fructose reductase (1,5-anhydro-D-mannitol-forming)